ncbi:MAG TPA: PaaI family thioesterase [Gemmatimonadaceae bacterium]|nr:PaaI family thioesterase [Gemmatimonadaceae bacterium]
MTDRDDHFRRLERMYLGAPANEYFRPEIRVDDGMAEVRLAVRPDFFHAASAVHGSVYFKLLDDATFFAASSLVRDVFVLTASFNIYFLRPISSGTMTARGVIVSRSSRLLIGEGVLVDADGKEIARGSGTFMPSRVPLDDRVGYSLPG